MTKFYVDGSGKYLGGFEGRPKKGGGEKDHPGVPAAATEVPAPPGDARQVWNGAKWSAAPPADPEPLTGEEIFDMLETKGVLAAGDRPRPKPARA